MDRLPSVKSIDIRNVQTSDETSNSLNLEEKKETINKEATVTTQSSDSAKRARLDRDSRHKNNGSAPVLTSRRPKASEKTDSVDTKRPKTNASAPAIMPKRRAKEKADREIKGQTLRGSSTRVRYGSGQMKVFESRRTNVWRELHVSKPGASERSLVGLALIAEPGIDCVSDLLNKKTLNDIWKHLRNDSHGVEELGQMASSLGQTLADKINSVAKNGSQENKDFQYAVSISSGDLFKEQVETNLLLIGSNKRSEQLLDNMKSFVNLIFASFKEGAANDLLTNGLEVEIFYDPADIAGEIYIPKIKDIAPGANGAISIYACGEKRIVLKQIRIPVAQTNSVCVCSSELAAESRMHFQAAGGGHKNVLGCIGLTRMSNEMLALGLEYAPYGSVEAFITKLRALANQGKINALDKHIAKVTILHDMLEGLCHVQKERGILHLDIKPPNFYIGQTGVIKLADFGTSKAGEEANLNTWVVENPAWTAPEFDMGAGDINEAKASLKSAAEKRKTALRTAGDGKSDEVKKEIKKLNKETDKSLAALSYKVTQHCDTWSLGVSAFELFFGFHPFMGDGHPATRKTIKEFCAIDSANARKKYFSDLIESKKDSFLSGDDLNDDAIDLIVQMLAPAPEDRLDLAAARDHKIFNVKWLNTATAYDVIMKIADSQ
ncbi:MAG: uncharacterized protein JWQ23_362 [Herminiimonas sp.]|nr:uncharacterized protein [Herminiimonas sp.]